MKKTYIKPETDTTIINAETALLAASTMGVDTSEEIETAGSRQADFWDED